MPTEKKILCLILGVVYRSWERLPAPERKRILKQAEIYRRNLNGL